MANEGSTRLSTSQLLSMIGGGANRDQLLSSTSSSGGVAYSTPQSAQTAYNEAIQRHAVTAAFRAVQRATTRAEAEIRYVDLQMERATANAMANGNIQVDRVPIVNSSATTTQVTTKNLDSFTDRPSIVQSEPIVVKVQTVKQDNNNPIIDDPIVNYAGIGEFQVTEVSKPSNSTSTVQNNKNNSSTTMVNKVNLIPDVNYLPVNTTELNKFATPKGVAPLPKEDTNYSNIAIVGAAAAVLTGIVVIGSKRR